MKLLVFLFAVLAVIAMVSANNPLCKDTAQSGGGYVINEMSAGRAARGNNNYGSRRIYNRPTH